MARKTTSKKATSSPGGKKTTSGAARKTAKATPAANKSSRKGAADKSPLKSLDHKRRFPRVRRAIRWILIGLIIVAILPFVLTIFYRAESVKPVSTLMLGRYLTFQSVFREWKPLDQISPALPQSVLSSEDGKFCSHGGVDWAELNTVIEDALDGEKTRGASTITMQLAKNLFLWQGRSFVRKGLELPLALWIDFVIPKRRIMEIYLNVVEWDVGVFGAEGAARGYFKRGADRLTRRQAALLAVTLPNPKARNPGKPSRKLSSLARRIERRARASGAYIKCLGLSK